MEMRGRLGHGMSCMQTYCRQRLRYVTFVSPTQFYSALEEPSSLQKYIFIFLGVLFISSFEFNGLYSIWDVEKTATGYKDV
jgi:hypothetical protein